MSHVVVPPGIQNRTSVTQGLSVIIPVYNEEQGIGPVLTQLSCVLTGSGLSHEVIVVDDGSCDGTISIVGQHPGVILIRHQHNQGYGAALKTGIRHANFDLTCITDADGTYPCDLIPDLLERLVKSGYDMIVGARTMGKVAIPLIRRPAKWAIGQLANFVAGQPIPDPNSGLRVFRREVALQLFNVLPNGFSFTTTITLAMLTNGYLVNYTQEGHNLRFSVRRKMVSWQTLSVAQEIQS